MRSPLRSVLSQCCGRPSRTCTAVMPTVACCAWWASYLASWLQWMGLPTAVQCATWQTVPSTRRYALVWLASSRQGDVLVDPCCGGVCFPALGDPLAIACYTYSNNDSSQNATSSLRLSRAGLAHSADRWHDRARRARRVPREALPRWRSGGRRRRPRSCERPRGCNPLGWGREPEGCWGFGLQSTCLVWLNLRHGTPRHGTPRHEHVHVHVVSDVVCARPLPHPLQYWAHRRVAGVGVCF